MSIQSQEKNINVICALLSHDLGYIYGEKESGPNGAKKEFHRKSAAFLRTLGKDLGFIEFKVNNNYAGIAVSGEITLMGIWADGNGLYFQINQPMAPFNCFLYRTIEHMKDYKGGQNCWLPLTEFQNMGYKSLCDLFLTLKRKEAAKHAA